MKQEQLKLSRRDYANATLQALRELGGSGSKNVLNDKAVTILGLTDEQIKEPYQSGKTAESKVEKQLGWARTNLKKDGLIDNIVRGIWTLTPKGRTTNELDLKAVDEEEPPPTIEDEWRGTLRRMLREMDPTAFERLCALLLAASGFEVEGTKQSGDGGIDGIGVVRISGFLSFRVLFQCKRYKGSVTAGTVRDFRGAMTGRTDKGLIVTTGNFTPAAVREATRDGAPEIDLVDGEQLVDKLKELELGVKTEKVMTERVTVNPDFFANI